MSDDAWLALDPNEAVVWDASPRLMRAAPAALASLAVVLVGAVGVAVGEPLAGVLLLVAPLPGGYGYLRVRSTRFVVTNRRLYRKRGLLGIDVRTVERRNVQNVRSKQGVLGTRFDYGTVTIELAGGRDLRFYDVYDPDDVRRLLDRDAQSAIPGTVTQWRAIRDELRELRRLFEA